MKEPSESGVRYLKKVGGWPKYVFGGGGRDGWA